LRTFILVCLAAAGKAVDSRECRRVVKASRRCFDLEFVRFAIADRVGRWRTTP
jgi:hypothetical protein